MSSFQDTDWPVDPHSQRVHDAAVAVIAKRNEARGVAADDYDYETYVRAVEEAERLLVAPPADPVLSSLLRAVKDTFKDLGYAETAGPITDTWLHARALEILAEQGLDTPPRSREHYNEAIRLALMELPPEKRKEVAERYGFVVDVSAEQREQMLDDAIAAGRILPQQREAYAVMAMADPAFVAHFLGQLPVDGQTDSVVFASPVLRKAAAKMTASVDGRVYGPDEQSLRLHLRAEEIGLEKGWATKNNVSGEVEFPDEASYRQAIYAADEEAEDAKLAQAEASGKAA